MPDNLNDGTLVVIRSFVENEALGTLLFEPPIGPPRPLPIVALRNGSGIMPSKFSFHKVGKNVYTITLYGRNVAVENDRVYAFANKPAQEWVIEHRQPQNGFTIVKMGTHLAWTNLQENEDQIEVRPLIEIRSLPPQYLYTQLFRFELVVE